ncbi:MAG TPA: hypothetical protein VD838_15565, partial [Anaeromyxobacteraceae bacterium]|nr:hypothetical protein [Anaeromyxobacteraceae bacterium]
PLLVRLTTGQRPLSVSNLGPLDRLGLPRDGPIRVESVFGAVSSVLDASVLTVYTISDRLRLHALANESDPSATVIRDELDRAVRRLVDAIG